MLSYILPVYRWVYRYDEILVNGLPDWRQPVYYYRRVRKMGVVELSILLMVILTTGHIITLWSIYLERRFEKVLLIVVIIKLFL